MIGDERRRVIGNLDTSKIKKYILNLNNKNFKISKPECDHTIFPPSILNEKSGKGSLTTIALKFDFEF